MLTKEQIANLSLHLFWDVDVAQLNYEEHKKFIISRVLMYGDLKDFRLIVAFIGLEEIGRIATNIRELDVKSCHFISFLSGIPLEEFTCYTSRQSLPPSSDYFIS